MAGATAHCFSHNEPSNSSVAWYLGLVKHCLPFLLACLLNIYSFFKPLFNHLFLSPLIQREFYIKEISFDNVYLTTHYAKIISFNSKFTYYSITH